MTGLLAAGLAVLVAYATTGVLALISVIDGWFRRRGAEHEEHVMTLRIDEHGGSVDDEVPCPRCGQVPSQLLGGTNGGSWGRYRCTVESCQRRFVHELEPVADLVRPYYRAAEQTAVLPRITNAPHAPDAPRRVRFC